MVLDKGRIVEFDAPKKLLSNTNSIFFSMAKSAGLISEWFHFLKLSLSIIL